MRLVSGGAALGARVAKQDRAGHLVVDAEHVTVVDFGGLTWNTPMYEFTGIAYSANLPLLKQNPQCVASLRRPRLQLLPPPPVAAIGSTPPTLRRSSSKRDGPVAKESGESGDSERKYECATLFNRAKARTYYAYCLKGRDLIYCCTFINSFAVHDINKLVIRYVDNLLKRPFSSQCCREYLPAS